MTTDLQYLAYSALLTASLWIVYIAAQVMTNGFLAPQNYVDPAPRPVPLWGQRANRAHLNAVESFAPFAALILIAHVAGKADAADRLVRDRLLLAEARACGRLLAGAALHSHPRLHPGVDRGCRAVLPGRPIRRSARINRNPPSCGPVMDGARIRTRVAA